MKPRFRHKGEFFEDGDIVTVTTQNDRDRNPYENCMIAYGQDTNYGGYKWFILSNNRVFDGRPMADRRGYTYSWIIDIEINKIEHGKKKYQGKWTNGIFRRKLIEKNLI